MKIPAMPGFITKGTAQVSEFVKTHISGKFPTIPETSRTTKVGVGAVTVLAAGTVAYVAMSAKQKQGLSNLWTRFTTKAGDAGKAVAKYVKENQTTVIAVAATVVTVSGGALAYRYMRNEPKPLPPKDPLPPQNPTEGNPFPQSLIPIGLDCNKETGSVLESNRLIGEIPDTASNPQFAISTSETNGQPTASSEGTPTQPAQTQTNGDPIDSGEEATGVVLGDN